MVTGKDISSHITVSTVPKQKTYTMRNFSVPDGADNFLTGEKTGKASGIRIIVSQGKRNAVLPHDTLGPREQIFQ